MFNCLHNYLLILNREVFHHVQQDSPKPHILVLYSLPRKRREIRRCGRAATPDNLTGKRNGTALDDHTMNHPARLSCLALLGRCGRRRLCRDMAYMSFASIRRHCRAYHTVPMRWVDSFLRWPWRLLHRRNLYCKGCFLHIRPIRGCLCRSGR